MRSLLRRIFGIVPTLDLHGLGVRRSLDETRDFLAAAHEAGEPQVPSETRTFSRKFCWSLFRWQRKEPGERSG